MNVQKMRASACGDSMIGAREKENPRFFGTEFIAVTRGRDVFESPQGCSETHPVGKDESSRPVARAHDVREKRSSE
jgi:hypothetical protein